jgi:hypothetical protein
VKLDIVHNEYRVILGIRVHFEGKTLEKLEEDICVHRAFDDGDAQYPVKGEGREDGVSEGHFRENYEITGNLTGSRV